MQFPPLDSKILKKIGVPAMPAPIISPTIYAGIDLKEHKAEKASALSSEECINMFGAREAVLMNFIPQMLTAIAIEQAEEFIKYCRDNRLSEYKRHNRHMRKCVDEYNFELRRSYKSAWYAYQNYYNRLRNTIEVDLFKCWCTFTNEASHQYVGHPHKDIPARVAFIRMILDYVESYDKKIDQVISERIHSPCSRKQDPYCLLISVLCIDIAETFGQSMQITENMNICVNVLANRCRQVVDAIMADEDASETKNLDKI